MSSSAESGTNHPTSSLTRVKRLYPACSEGMMDTTCSGLTNMESSSSRGTFTKFIWGSLEFAGSGVRRMEMAKITPSVRLRRELGVLQHRLHAHLPLFLQRLQVRLGVGPRRVVNTLIDVDQRRNDRDLLGVFVAHESSQCVEIKLSR